MKIFKKALCIFLIVVMCLTSAPLQGFVGLEWPSLPEFNFGDIKLPEIDFGKWFSNKAQAVDLAASGQCGENVYWNYNSTTGELVISGTGSMYNYDFWNLRSPFEYTNIKTVYIKQGVTTVGDQSFEDCKQLTDLFVENGVAIIGERAFAYCYNLKNATLSDSITTIGNSAFSGCNKLANIEIPNNTITIGDYAFSGCDSITNISIPNNTTTIGSYAFSSCDSMTTIEISANVTDIGTAAFSGCEDLIEILVNENNMFYSSDENGVLFNFDKTNLIIYPLGKEDEIYTIPDSVVTVGESAFGNCNNLKQVNFGRNVKMIERSAFSGCNNLSSVILPNGLEKIDSNSFSSSIIEKIVIPNSVTFIGENSFNNCSKLVNIEIENPMAEIGADAFKGTAVYNNHSKGVVYIDNIAVGYKGEMPEKFDLIIKDGTVAIANNVFNFSWPEAEGLKLKSVVFPDSLVSIGKNSFVGCDNLETLKLGKNLLVVGDHSFYNTSSKSLHINDISSFFKISFGYTNFFLAEVYIGNKIATSINIPEGVETLEQETFAFIENSSVSGLYVPDSVKTIEDNAIENFTVYCNINSYAATYCENNSIPYVLLDAGDTVNIVHDNLQYYGYANIEWTLDKRTGVLQILGGDKLPDFDYYDYAESSTPWNYLKAYITEVILPNNYIYIGDYSFMGLYRLTKINIPNSVSVIGSCALSECSLYELHLPESLTVLKSGSLRSNNFSSIDLPETLTTIENNVFYHCNNLRNLYIPKNVNFIGDVNFYQNYMESFIVDENNQFFSSVNGVLFSKDQTKIISFPNYSEISTYRIPDSVKIIERGAINCYYEGAALKELIIPDSVERIEDSGICHYSIEKIQMGNSVKYIGERAFCGTKIKDITLPKTLVEIGPEAFYGCEELNNIEIPEGIKRIETNTFWACGNLNSVTIPSSVEYIGSGAFETWYGLEQVYYNGSENKWNKIEIINWNNHNDDLLNATIYFLGEDEPDEPEYDSYRLQLRSDGRYSDSIAVGNTIGFYTYLSENGKLLDCERSYAISFDNPSIFEVIETEITEPSFDVTLKAKKVGTTNMTISDNITGAYVTIRLKANNPKEIITMDEVKDLAKEYQKDKLTNFYDYNGLYIDGYFYQEYSDGSYRAYMNAYNEKAYYGAVVSYDKNGNIVDHRLIKPQDKLPTSIWSGFIDSIDVIDDHLKKFKDKYLYDEPTFTKHSDVDELEVPEGGYFVITNNYLENEYVFFANTIDIALDLMFAYSSTKKVDIPDSLSEKVVEKTIKDLLEEIGKDALKSIYKKMIKVFTKGITIDNVDAFMSTLVGVFKEYEIDFEGMIKEVVDDLNDTETKLDFAEDALLTILGAGTVKAVLSSLGYINTAIKLIDIFSGSLSSEIIIYTPPEEEKTRTSNGVKVTSETPLDPDYVLHSYIINEADDVMVDAKPTIEAMTSNYQMYDITLYKSSQAVQPNSKIKVMIPIPAGYNKNKIQVYWYKADGTLLSMNAKVQGDYAVFETDHLSYYVLVEEEQVHGHSYEVASTVNSTCTETGTITYTCSCGDSYTEVVPATGHMFSEGNSKCSNCDFDRAEGCDCKCHKGGIAGFFFKLILFFQKIFKQNKYCSGCGVAHY